jgi:hypothetical protein
MQYCGLEKQRSTWAVSDRGGFAWLMSGDCRIVNQFMTCSMRKMSNDGVCWPMTEPSLPLRDGFLLSPRTVSYIDALIREGDKFHYSKWLRRVREGEAQAKQGLRTFISKNLIAPEIGNQTGTSDGIWPNLKLMTRAAPTPGALRRPHPQAESKTPKARVMRWLERISSAWDEFQASRTRDAVYGYLDAVFAIVEHYRVRRRTNRLLRHAAKFSGLPLENNADPFAAVIRCTSGNGVDSKTISKWARALRYVAHCKGPRTRLKTFMKEAGGVNACADRYAKYLRRSRR